MKATMRRKRAAVRDRRRGPRGDYDGPPIIGPLTGYDLYLTRAYSAVSHWYDRQGRPMTDGQRTEQLLADPKYSRVARTEIVSAADPGTAYSVSTVWLGLDHRFGDGPPLIFETMVFATSTRDELTRRYSTEQEAREGHAEVVTLVAATVPDEVVTHVD